jgi:hypothetical protein
MSITITINEKQQQNQTEATQLIYTHVDYNDPFIKLPQVLSIHILKYLYGHEIAMNTSVNKLWKKQCESSLLWKLIYCSNYANRSNIHRLQYKYEYQLRYQQDQLLFKPYNQIPSIYTLNEQFKQYLWIKKIVIFFMSFHTFLISLICYFLFFLFICLKWDHYINWNWLQVCIPCNKNKIQKQIKIIFL